MYPVFGQIRDRWAYDRDIYDPSAEDGLLDRVVDGAIGRVRGAILGTQGVREASRNDPLPSPAGNSPAAITGEPDRPVGDEPDGPVRVLMPAVWTRDP